MQNIIIKGGTVIHAQGREKADVLCQEGRIVSVGPDIPTPGNTRCVDASGALVFPGFVDPHVHAYLQAGPNLARDSYASASRAALCGGTTFFFDFVLPDRNEDPAETIKRWDAQSTGQSYCDFGYHLGVTHLDPGVENAMHKILHDRGINSLKVHLAYTESLALDDATLLKTMQFAAAHDSVLMVHCENAGAIDLLRDQLAEQGRTAPEAHGASRPEALEADGVAHITRLADLTDTHIYIVHLSSAAGLEEALHARARGRHITIETLPQFLLLDETAMQKPNFEGAKYVMSPPLRAAENQQPLWESIADGRINTVGTDHAPFDWKGQKEAGRNDFRKIASGLPGIEERIMLLYTHGVRTGRITEEQLVAVAATQPARTFGLQHKGRVAVDCDADLVIWDPEAERTLSAQSQQSQVDYNAYEGWTVRGAPSMVVMRGHIMVEDGQFCGSTCHGRYTARNKNPLL